MLSSSLILALAAIGTNPQPSTPVSDPPTTAEVRQGLERGVTFLEKAGVNWLDKRKCIACHHGQWMVWGMNEARRAGVAVNAKQLETLTVRVSEMYLAERANYEKNKQGYVEGTYLLIGQYGGPGAENEKVGEGQRVAAALVAAAQRGNGTWKYAGQGLHWPATEADEATTLWAAIALDSRGKADETASASRDRALAWLKQAPRGAGNDVLALRLAIELKFGDSDRAKTLADELLSRQNADGGWSWSKDRPSDAFATGESLYALGLAGVKDNAPAIGAARKFLLATQKPDGSWQSPTRKAKGEAEISSYWGSAWAVIGLARTLRSEIE